MRPVPHFPRVSCCIRSFGKTPETVRKTRPRLVPSMRLLPLVGRVDPLLVGLSGT